MPGNSAVAQTWLLIHLRNWFLKSKVQVPKTVVSQTTWERQRHTPLSYHKQARQLKELLGQLPFRKEHFSIKADSPLTALETLSHCVYAVQCSYSRSSSLVYIYCHSVSIHLQYTKSRAVLQTDEQNTNMCYQVKCIYSSNKFYGASSTVSHLSDSLYKTTNLD